MKSFFRLFMALVVSVTTFVACGDDEPVKGDELLDVIPSNISGYWSVVETNGQQLDKDCYVYLNIIRKDCRIEIYQNVDSFSARMITGTYNIYIDEEFGCAVIRGDYDHGIGYWDHRYIVSDLTRESMVWTSTDGQVVTRYKRIDAIPDDVVE